MDASGQMLNVLIADASIVKYRFRRYFYYHHSLLIMFGIEALVPTNLDDAMSSFAMPINFYCTIRLQLTFLYGFTRKEEKKCIG